MVGQEWGGRKYRQTSGIFRFSFRSQQSEYRMKVSHKFLVSHLMQKLMLALRSIKCAIALCLKKKKTVKNSIN